LAKRIVSIPHKFQLAGAISFRNDYSPPTSPSSRPYSFSLIRTFMSSNFCLGLLARKDFSALGFSLIRTFMSSNFCLGLFAHKDFSTLGFSLIKTFMSSNFYLGLFARKDFSVLGFLLIRTFMSSNFCLGLFTCKDFSALGFFAHKDFIFNLVGSKAKGSEAPIRDCVSCLLLSSVIACFTRR
jgi:hypothetical protein